MKPLQRVRNRILGQTTVHLQHEFYLVVCLVLLTTATLTSIYHYPLLSSSQSPNNTNDNKEDRYIVLLTGLWLSRFLFLRIICPNYLYGLLAELIAKCFCAGQYFDRLGSSTNLILGTSFSETIMVHHHHSSSSSSSKHSSIKNLGSGSSSCSRNYALAVMMRCRSYLYYFYYGYFCYYRCWFVMLFQEWKKTFSLNVGGEDDNDGAGGSLASDNRVGYNPVVSASSASASASSSSKQKSHKLSSSSASSARSSSSSSNTANLIRLWNQCCEYIPPIQLCLVIIVTIFCLTGLLFNSSNSSGRMRSAEEHHFFKSNPLTSNIPYHHHPHHPSSTGPGSSSSRSPASGDTGFIAVGWGNNNNLGSSSSGSSSSSSSNSGNIPAGPYYGNSILGVQSPHSIKDKPSLYRYTFRMTVWSTLLSMILYGRVVLPLVGLVAGGWYKTAGQQKLPKTTKKDTPWAERYKPITQQNRFRLYCQIAALRILEHVYICSFLPQTVFACEVVGYCDSSSLLYGLRQNTVALSPSSSLLYRLIVKDYVTLILILMSIIFVTLLLLTAQMIALDRTFFNTFGHVISGEYASSSTATAAAAAAAATMGLEDCVSDGSAAAINTSSTVRNHTRGGKYRKGGNNAMSSSTATAATVSGDKDGSASENTKQMDIYLRLAYFLFHNSTIGGHKDSASFILSNIIRLHFGFISFLASVFTFYRFILGYNDTALILALLANIIAFCATIRVGSVRSCELNKIGDDILGAVQRFQEKKGLDEDYVGFAS